MAGQAGKDRVATYFQIRAKDGHAGPDDGFIMKRDEGVCLRPAFKQDFKS